ncbi:MAG: hypothetical protein DWI22_13870 [Planctomycetota bacterium]|nr:MAG: hypothetical protein DWI22_13870 [Planctomycetota bacterium]
MANPANNETIDRSSLLLRQSVVPRQDFQPYFIWIPHRFDTFNHFNRGASLFIVKVASSSDCWRSAQQVGAYAA